MTRSTKYKEIKKKKDGVASNENFWSMIKPFLTNKAHINEEEINLKCDNETITESSVLVEMLNSFRFVQKPVYIYIYI